jgi:exodeoxyribonuclease-1
MAASLYWYDIETFGRHPQLDRFAQFAGLRTDDHFQPQEEPRIEYVRTAPDYVPDPYACLKTGITPQDTAGKGIPEYEFARKIYDEWLRPGTCVVGYNNIRFDDEFMRSLFYRNLLDPYVREYSRGNSRWDLINVVRAARDLRPEGLQWPNLEDGRPSFRLEELTEANGIGHEKAHDALSDVWATIGIARLLHRKQPKLFRYLFEHRTKQKASRLLDLQHRSPVLYTDGIFTRPAGCTSVVAPLAVDPYNRNAVIAFDLRSDPRPLLELTVERIRERVFTPREELEEERIPLISIHINKSPVLAPLKSLDDAAAQRLEIDREQVEQHRRLLQEAVDLTEKVRAVFEQPPGGEPEDVDLAIYSGGFFLDEDKQVFERLHAEGLENWREAAAELHDSRAPRLLKRLIGRNYPELFHERERQKWKNFCATRLLFPPGNRIDDFGTFEKKLETLRRSTDLGPQEKLIVRRLFDYRDELKRTVLAYSS